MRPPIDITSDEVWPRDEEHRYRLYSRIGRQLDVLAAAPDPGGLGEAIIGLHRDEQALGRRLCDLGRIGVLDVLGGKDGKGDWVIPLWDRTAA